MAASQTIEQVSSGSAAEPKSAAPQEGLLQQVQRIKEALGLDEPTAPALPALKKANELMGLPSEGTLPEQAAKLLQALGI